MVSESAKFRVMSRLTGTGLDLAPVTPLTSVTFPDSWWETVKCPVFVQVHYSHIVASIDK
jgi:hypothetical protein